VRPTPGEVLHFSEDPTIERFVPHVVATSTTTEAFVWAVDGPRSPDYWFPRQCPRGMAWVVPATTRADRDRVIGAGGGTRVHAIEYGWLPAIQAVRLYAYRLPSAPFRHPSPTETHCLVATETVVPLGPAEPVGDLLALHEAAGIQLRVLDNLWPWWDEVIKTTLGWSGIRLRNARPRVHRGPL